MTWKWSRRARRKKRKRNSNPLKATIEGAGATPCAFHLLPNPLQWIDCHPRNPQFPVQMGASAQARAADLAKKLSPDNPFTGLDVQGGQVPVTGKHTVSMIQDNGIAPYEQRLCKHHSPSSRRVHRRSCRRPVVLARVSGHRRIVAVGATRAIRGSVAEFSAQRWCKTVQRIPALICHAGKEFSHARRLSIDFFRVR